MIDRGVSAPSAVLILLPFSRSRIRPEQRNQRNGQKKKQKHGKKKNDSKHFACMNDLAMLVVRGRGEGEAADAGRDFTYFLRAYMCCIDNAGLGVWRMRDDREKISLSKLVWAGEHEFYR